VPAGGGSGSQAVFAAVGRGTARTLSEERWVPAETVGVVCPLFSEILVLFVCGLAVAALVCELAVAARSQPLPSTVARHTETSDGGPQSVGAGPPGAQ
jgi:hypothetical protein